ncbi:MAG TPA: FtsX-like permease family protein [Chitinophagaceae bacterium]|nr:FtsX-like permease family protein [Chitinophagaceae bacterium]
MLKNYFKIGLRNLWKNKVFSAINVLGLTIGLASFLLIALYLFDELTFDRFHKNGNHIYRVVEDITTPEGKRSKVAGVNYQVSEKARTEIPGINNIVRLFANGRANVSTTENANVFYEPFITGTAGFLQIFDFKLLQGDRNTALATPHTVIVTEETARKFFGTKEVMGKTLKIDRDSIPFKITGILKNFPVNSHINFHLLFAESASTGFRNFVNVDWSSNIFSSYVMLDGKTDPHSIETKMNQMVLTHRDADNKIKSSFILQPLHDIHFHSADIEGSSAYTGNMTYIYVFCIVGLFVLLIACINYMNLTTARFTNRAREIGVRKVAGASRKNLVTQFLFEAFLITCIALVIAIGLVKILLPAFNAFTQKQLTLGLETDYRIWVGIFLIIIFVGLVTGIYPSLFQSGRKPFFLLKNKINIGKGNLSIRRSLVVFQFSLSIIMIIATMIIYQQMQYVSKKDMGFKKDQLVVIDINSGHVRREADLIKTEVSKLSQVKAISVSSRVPGEWKDIPRVKVKQENTAAAGKDMYFLGVDDQFLKTYAIDLIKGRNFQAGSLGDSSAILINETAAKELGITEPLQQAIEMPSADFDGDVGVFTVPYRANIVGIVRDFNFRSLHEPLAPMVIGFQNNPVQSIDYFTVRMGMDQAAGTLKEMDDILHGVDQNHLLEYHFLNKQWDLFYRQDRIRQTIFIIVAMLTIFIACLGLFGLATYAAQQRIKEIGIRKVLGASVTSIVSMLSRDFLKLVLFATLIAFPVAWWAMKNWLGGFAYRISIGWSVFVVSALLAVLIAFITISFQAIRAAIANPVKSLRTE